MKTILRFLLAIVVSAGMMVALAPEHRGGLTYARAATPLPSGCYTDSFGLPFCPVTWTPGPLPSCVVSSQTCSVVVALPVFGMECNSTIDGANAATSALTSSLTIAAPTTSPNPTPTPIVTLYATEPTATSTPTAKFHVICQLPASYGVP